MPDVEHGCARIEWEAQPVEGVRAEDLLGAPVDAVEVSWRNECSSWLAYYLDSHDGEAKQTVVMAAARAEGYSPDQVKRAKERAGVTSVKSAWGGAWVWRRQAGPAPTEQRVLTPEAPLPSPPSGPEALPSTSAAEPEHHHHARDGSR
ncbi:hypothetical protein [Xylanimonas sp. McL0601]|uniref:hypothetical protein n=1 Tax=Xylanimonas sp. McL0601 TaxID=3414739 RepID=UPI003CECFC48